MDLNIPTFKNLRNSWGILFEYYRHTSQDCGSQKINIGTGWENNQIDFVDGSKSMDFNDGLKENGRPTWWNLDEIVEYLNKFG